MTDYLTPTTVEEVVNLLTADDSRAMLIAGGTDVLPDIRKGKRASACLVDITRIPELSEIRVGEGYVTVGAAVTFSMLREHAYLCEHVHALVEAAGSVGAAPIQSAATWGGNLVQAMPVADGGIIAITLGAELRVVDRQGERWIPVLDTFAGPGRSHIDPTRQLITTIRFPTPATPWGTAWRRAGRRPSLILPTLNSRSSSCWTDDGSRITDAAIGMGPVAPAHIAPPKPSLSDRPRAWLVTFVEAAAWPNSAPTRVQHPPRLARIPPGDPAGAGGGGVEGGGKKHVQIRRTDDR